MNECEGINPCGSWGSCLNIPGSYDCNCQEGFVYEEGRCQDLDECALWMNPCGQGKGECVNEEPGYSCACSPGFKLSEKGGECVDVDECTEDQDACGDHGACQV